MNTIKKVLVTVFIEVAALAVVAVGIYFVAGHTIIKMIDDKTLFILIK